MKYIAFVLALLLMASCATSSTTSSPVTIDGTWEGEYDSGMDGQPPMLFTFNFTSEGESLGGFVRGSFGPTGPGEGTPLENGKIKGNHISFTSRPKDTQMTFKYKGKIDGDKIKITYKVEMPGMGKSRSAGRSMTDDEGGQIRSGRMLSMGRIGGPGMGMESPLSGEFTIIRVK